MLLETAQHLSKTWLNWRGLKSRWLKTKTGPLHYYEGNGKGKLPPLVLLHGISSNASVFSLCLQQLKPHLKQVLAPDAPGHGFSPAPRPHSNLERSYEALCEFLDNKLKEPLVLAGNSLGGGFALRYGLDRPEKIKALILISPAGAPMEAAELKNFLASFPTQSAAQAMAFLRRLYWKPPAYLPLIAQEVHKLFTSPAIQALLHSITPQHYIKPEELASLKMPLLLLWGRADGVMPHSHLGYFKEHLPKHAVIEEPQDFGHCPHLDNAGKLSERILAFARQILATKKY